MGLMREQISVSKDWLRKAFYRPFEGNRGDLYQFYHPICIIYCIPLSSECG